MQPLPKTLFPFFWHFIKPYKRYALGALLVDLLWATHVAVVPYIFKVMIDTVVNYKGEPYGFGKAIFWPAFLYVAMYIYIGILFRFYDYITLTLMPNIKRDIQQKMMHYLEGHSHKYFQNNFAGSLSNKINDMVRGIPEILSIILDFQLPALLGILFASIAMSFVSPIFSAILICWAIIYFFITFKLSKKGEKYAFDFAESGSVLSGKQVDSISNVINVRLFARINHEVLHIKKYMDDTVNKDRKVQWYILKVRIFQFISMASAISAVLFYLIKQHEAGQVTAGDFVMILTMTMRILDVLWNAANQFVRFAQTVGTCQQALTIITQDHEITDLPDAKDLEVTGGNIVFENVTFNYQQNSNLFQNKHVEIEAGSKVGLVGFSGSGKTTFVNLILRFFDIESGRILIDGQDIAKVTQDSLHTNISMIPQDTSLFHRSLMENIRYGRLEAGDDEVIEASKKAHCHEFIEKLPEGYNSLVGERGIKLSGGQRQRIAIARAMLKNAPILILDEATSALDSVTEKYIQNGLHELMQGHTTIVVAHRLSTLSEMDRILVFDKGHIIEDGTHKQLLKKKGHYAKMWEMQAGGFLPESPE